MTRLTLKQEVVLEFIQRYIAEHQLAPLIREVQAGCQIASYKSTVDRLTALERKAYIKREPSTHRGIRLVRRRVDVPAQPVSQEPVGA